MDSNRYHPGTCTATKWGQRYNTYLEPQLYDDVQHQWHLAMDKNWGPWSCCGGAANSPPCTVRPSSSIDTTSNVDSSVAIEKKSKGVGAFIYFYEKGNLVRVVGEQIKCWNLEGGRIAKKKTEGKVWTWLESLKK